MANLRVVPETVGDRIVLLLRRLKWDVKRLAIDTGIPASSLSRYVNDETRIPADRLVAIAEALGVTPNELLLGSETDSGDRSTARESSFPGWVSHAEPDVLAHAAAGG